MDHGTVTVDAGFWATVNAGDTYVNAATSKPFEVVQGTGARLVARLRASGIPVTEKTASFTLAANEVESLLEYNSASAGTMTIPPDSGAVIAVGASVAVAQAGSGQLTVAPGSGVTVHSEGGRLKTAGQHAMASAIKVAANTWRLEGNLVT